MTSLAGRNFLRKPGVPRVDDGTVDPWEGVSAAVSVKIALVGCDVYCLPHSSGKPVRIGVQDLHLDKIDCVL